MWWHLWLPVLLLSWIEVPYVSYICTHSNIYNIIINPDFFKAAWHFSRLLETPSMRATCFPTLAKAHVTAVKQEPKSPKPAQTKAKEVLGMNRIRTCLAYFHLLYNMHKIHRRDRCIYIIQDPAKVQKTCGGLYGAEATDSQLTVPGVSWLPSMSMQTEWQNNEISGCISLFACM